MYRGDQLQEPLHADSEQLHHELVQQARWCPLLLPHVDLTNQEWTSLDWLILDTVWLPDQVRIVWCLVRISEPQNVTSLFRMRITKFSLVQPDLYRVITKARQEWSECCPDSDTHWFHFRFDYSNSGTSWVRGPEKSLTSGLQVTYKLMWIWFNTWFF